MTTNAKRKHPDRAKTEAVTTGDDNFSAIVERQRDVELEKLAKQIRKHTGKAAMELIRVGGLLQIGWRLFARRGRGSRFGAWVESFGFDRRRAYEWMQIARTFADCEVAPRLGVTTLKLLSGPATPPAARDVVLEKLRGNEQLSVKQVKEIVAAQRGRTAIQPKRTKPLSVAVDDLTLVLHCRDDVDRDVVTQLLRDLAVALKNSTKEKKK